jgi:hypothetical protein
MPLLVDTMRIPTAFVQYVHPYTIWHNTTYHDELLFHKVDIFRRACSVRQVFVNVPEVELIITTKYIVSEYASACRFYVFNKW